MVLSNQYYFIYHKIPKYSEPWKIAVMKLGSKYNLLNTPRKLQK